MSGNTYLENRPELSNPTNSWRRLVEGIYLQKQGEDVFYNLVKNENVFLFDKIVNLSKMNRSNLCFL